MADSLNLLIHITESRKNVAEINVIPPVNVQQGEPTAIFIGHIDEIHYVSTIQCTPQLNFFSSNTNLFSNINTSSHPTTTYNTTVLNDKSQYNTTLRQTIGSTSDQVMNNSRTKAEKRRAYMGSCKENDTP